MQKVKNKTVKYPDIDPEKIFDLSTKAREFEGIDIHRAWERVSAETIGGVRKSFRPILIRLAAVGLVLVSLGIVAYYTTQPRTTVLVNNSETPQDVKLPDGTSVWLYPDADLHWVKNDFGNGAREVYLSGKAIFDVIKDSLQPFRVVTGEVTTQVLGTSFLLNATASEISLEVFRGRVAIFSQHSPKIKHQLVRGQRISFTNGTGVFTRPVEESGRQVGLKYQNTPLAAIVKEVCFIYDLHYGLSDSGDVNLRITGDFQGLTPKQIIGEINLVAGTHLVLRNDSLLMAH